MPHVSLERGTDGNKAVGRIEITNELNVARIWRVRGMKNRDITTLHLGQYFTQYRAHTIYKIF